MKEPAKTSDPHQGIADFRGEIDRIDGEIISLLEQRQAAARTIGGLKRRLGVPVIDQAREAEITRSLTAKGRRHLTSRHIQHIFKEIISAARSVQQQARTLSRREGAMGIGQPSVGIIGGTGRMGTWFFRFIEQRGMSVLKTGRTGPHSLEEVVRTCRVVVISVPIRKTLSIIRRIGPMMSEESLLMDLTSIKEAPLAAMVSCSRSEVVGLHPLFGPGDDSTREKRMVICRGRGEQGLSWIKDLLEEGGVETLMMEAAEHDRLMGIIQGANHLATLALALSIKRSGIPLEELMRGATPVFMERLERIQAMLGQPSELFSALMMENSHAGDSLRDVARSVEEWLEIVDKKDEKAFSDLFESLQSHFLMES